MNTTISNEELINFEKLSKLNLTDSETELIQRCIDYALSNCSKLSLVDTEGVEPLVHGIEMSNVFREDAAIKEFDREVLLSGAPERNEGFFQVPKTLDV